MMGARTYPHKFDINATNEEEIVEKIITSTGRENAIKELKDLKELLDLELITKEEFDKKSKELKKIILGN